MTTTDVSAAPATGAATTPQLTVALTYLVISGEPAVVFSSLADLSIGVFSDACTVDLIEEAGVAYRISSPLSRRDVHPPAMLGGPVSARAIRTLIRGAPVPGQPHYAGTIVHTWHSHHPCPGDATIAQLMVDRAIAVIAQRRRTDREQPTNDETADLQEALSTHRHVSMAVGILVAMHGVDAQAAVAMMREQSHRSNSTLSDVAERVVVTTPGSPTGANWPGVTAHRPKSLDWLQS